MRLSVIIAVLLIGWSGSPFVCDSIMPSASAQPHGWVQERPLLASRSAVPKYVNAVVAMNDSVMILGGEGGQIYRTQDMARTWQQIQTPFDHKIYFLRRLTGSACLALVDSGTVLRSTDAGLTWSATWVHKWFKPVDVSFCDSLHGVLSVNMSSGFDSLFLTSDGGISWTLRPATFADQPTIVCRISPTSLIAGETGLHVSHDNGVTWSKAIRPPVDPYDISFFDDSVGLMAGYNAITGPILRTTDGGSTWNTVFDDSTYGAMDRIVAMPNGTAVATGARGVLARSTDRGLTWTLQPPTDYDALTDISISPSGFGCAIDFYASTVFTFDGGRTWENREIFVQKYLTAISFSDTLHGALLTGSPNMYLTEDGGKNWLSTYSPHHSFRDVLRIGPNTILLLGDSMKGPLARSLDAGKTWFELQVDTMFYQFRQSNGRIYVVGPQHYMVSPDSGRTWHPYRFPTLANITDVSFLPNGMDGYLVAGSEAVFVTHDGGKVWNEKLTNHLALTRIIALDDTTVLASEGHGIFLSKDSGWTWKGVAGGNTFSFCDRMNGIAVGGNEQVYRTTDGGNKWKLQQSGYYPGYGHSSISPDFYSVSMIDSMNAYIVGDYGIVLHTQNGGNLPDVVIGGKSYDFHNVAINTTRDSLIVFSNPWADTLYIHQELVNGFGWKIGLSDTVLLPGAYATDTIHFHATDTLAHIARIALSCDSIPRDSLTLLAHGVKKFGGVISEQVSAIDDIALECLPNPVVSRANIELAMKGAGLVQVTIKDVRGAIVARVFEGPLGSGSHEINWDASELPSGRYECTVESSGRRASLPVIVVK